MKCGGIWGLVFAAALITGAAAGEAPRVIPAGLHWTDATHAELNFRVVPPAPVSKVTAKIGDVALADGTVKAYPYQGAITAVLFLIDTSDPRRARTVAQNAQDVVAMAKQAQPFHRMGLATFDTNFVLLAPIGPTPDPVVAAAQNVAAGGQTTELYRHVIDAIKVLAQTPAARRAVYLFSDGGAEDTAYRLDEVVKQALESDVAIYSFGFAERVSESVRLQSLRRLSEETNGEFTEGTAPAPLPASVLEHPFAAIDDGGGVDIDLTPAQSPIFQTNARLELSLAGAGFQSVLAFPVVLPRRPLNTSEFTIAVSTAAAFLTLLLVMAIRARKRAAARKPVPIAFLEFLDRDGAIYPITTTQLTIGRSRTGNQLRLTNDSVSAHHAVITQQRDGTFGIKEIASTNGVHINGEKAQEAKLGEGDTIALGEVRLRFRLSGAGSSAVS